MLAGHCPKSVARIFTGGRLLSLDKKYGGISSFFAIGFTAEASFQLRQYLRCCPSGSISRSRQLWFGTSGVCEVAIHADMRSLESLQPGHVVVKLDFSNAFNRLYRLTTGFMIVRIWRRHSRPPSA